MVAAIRRACNFPAMETIFKPLQEPDAGRRGGGLLKMVLRAPKTPGRNPKPPSMGAHHTSSKHRRRRAPPLTFSRQTFEQALFGAGAALCLFYFGATAYRSFASRLAVQTFEAAKSTRKGTTG